MALLSLNRINWFLTKSDFEDSIIDLTIALESLIPGKDELRYRFSLYLAFITESDSTRRIDTFKLFRTLYDTRSRIVHGGEHDAPSQRNEQKLKESWDELKRLSLLAMNYYLYFLSAERPDTWHEHLQSLILAGAARVVD